MGAKKVIFGREKNVPFSQAPGSNEQTSTQVLFLKTILQENEPGLLQVVDFRAGQEKHKMTLEHFVRPEHKEMLRMGERT